MSSNQKHQDYGRHIPNARKDLYNKGNLNHQNFHELSEDEKIHKVTKKSIWNIDYKDLYNKGYSAYGAYIVKTVGEFIKGSPDYTTYAGKITGNMVLDRQIINFIYVAVADEVKSQLLEKPIVDDKDFLSFYQKIFTRDIDFLLPENRHRTYIPSIIERINNKFEGGLLGEINKQFNTEESLKVIPEKLIAIILGHLVSMQFNGKIKKIYNPYRFSENTKDIALVEGWSKLIKGFIVESDESLLDNLNNDEIGIEINQENLAELLDNFAKTRFKTTKQNTTTIQLKTKLEQKHFSDVTRNGHDYLYSLKQQGKIVTSELLEETFGFNGTQWGSWVNGKNERQNILNFIYYSFMDLAQILNVPPESMSLDDGKEKLAMAFGSQGKKNQQGKFNTEHKYMHFPREKGHGALAHEWFHAYDNYLYLKAVNNGFVSNELQTKAKLYVRELFTNIVAAVLEKNKFDRNQLKHNIEYQELFKFEPHITQLVTDWMCSKYINIQKDDIESQYYIENDMNYYSIHDFVESVLDRYDQIIPELKIHLKNMQYLINMKNWDSDGIAYNRSVLNKSINALLPDNSKYRDCLYRDDVDNEETSVGTNLQDTLLLKEKDNIIKEMFVNINSIKNSIIQEDIVNQIRIQIENIVRSNVEKHINNYKTLIKQNNVIQEEILNNYQEYIEQHKQPAQIIKEKQLDKDINIQTAKEIRAQINQEIEEKIFNTCPDFIKKTISKLINNTNYISNITLRLNDEIMQQCIDSTLLENNTRTVLKIGESPYYKIAKTLDKALFKKGNKYYSMPAEMFARAGESYIANKITNTYLSDINFAISPSEQILLFPQQSDKHNFAQVIEQSIKRQFKTDYNLQLDNLPYVYNQFDAKHEKVVSPQNINIIDTEEPIQQAHHFMPVEQIDMFDVPEKSQPSKMRIR